MENDILKYQIIKARREAEQEVVAENMMGIDFHALDTKYNLQLLTEHTEELFGFGTYGKL